ncbi:MAG: acetyltransferase [Burkholderiales bacterium]|nr:acetyltransferase [Burkholderiales bacterium]
MDRSRLLILGASGHGRVVADIASCLNRYEQIAFLDDDEGKTSAMGHPVLGTIAMVDRYLEDFDLFVAVGNNLVRQRIQLGLKSRQARLATLVHPSAVLGSEVSLGEGTAVMAGAVINCGSIVGRGCIINTSASLDHDNVLEDFVHISPGAHLAGTVHVGECTWIGIGACVINNLRLAGGCRIGAGAVVVSDIVEKGTYVGVPARRRRS